MNIIKINNFVKKYGEFTAVSNFNLEITKGTIVGFVGKNGAGKSTTIRAIMNYIKPTEGKIIINNYDSQKDDKIIKKIISYIPSEAVFYDDIKCIDLLNFTIKFTSSTKKDVDRLVDYFELDTNKKITELSLGNKKKLSLIQGLLKDYEILILDEPTNGLDPLMQKKFFDLIKLEKEKGKTIFLSSHNLIEVEEYCDKLTIWICLK